jgi:hypothetical protein
MRILVACEFSGVVREAFRAKGHDAYSCDLLPSLDNSPYHIQEDVRNHLTNWDMMIAHPPCTYLCNSGVRWLSHPGLFPDPLGDRKVNQERWDKMEEAADFFHYLWYAPIEKICIENPVPRGWSGLPPYTQTIQPYQFGEDASKRTCLWLKGLPKLEATQLYPPRVVNGKNRWSNQTDSGQNKMTPSEDRAKLRSITYGGIAEAMADQWENV